MRRKRPRYKSLQAKGRRIATRKAVESWARENASTLVVRQASPEELAELRATPTGVVRPYTTKQAATVRPKK